VPHERDILLGEWKWIAGGDLQQTLGTDTAIDEKTHLQLPLHEVEASDHLRDGVLDL